MVAETATKPIVVLVHGYLDDESLWSEVRSELGRNGYRTVAPRIAWEGPTTLDDFTGIVVREITALAPEGGVVLVGHSMGAQVVELAARRLGDVRGLVLLSPVPLGGLSLPADLVEPLRGCGGRADIQRALRSQLSTSLSAAALDRLVDLGTALPADRVAGWFDAWSAGDPAAAAEPPPEVPTVLIVAEDPFVEGAVMALIRSRFRDAAQVTFGGAGHWPHIENPAATAAAVHDFLRRLEAPSDVRIIENADS